MYTDSFAPAKDALRRTPPVLGSMMYFVGLYLFKMPRKNVRRVERVTVKIEQ